MAIAVTNLRSVTGVAGTGSTTLAYLNPVTAGSTLVSGGANFNTSHASPAISDGVNGSHTVQAYGVISGTSVEAWLATFENTAAGTPTVTDNPAGASADIGIFFIGEATGAATSSVDKALVQSAVSNALNNSPFVVSGALAQANEAIVAVMSGTYGGSPSVTSLSGDGTYTAIVSNPDQTVQLGHAQYKIVATTVSDQADWTVVPSVGPNPGDGICLLMSIKDAGAAAARRFLLCR